MPFQDLMDYFGNNLQHSADLQQTVTNQMVARAKGAKMPDQTPEEKEYNDKLTVGMIGSVAPVAKAASPVVGALEEAAPTLAQKLGGLKNPFQSMQGVAAPVEKAALEVPATAEARNLTNTVTQGALDKQGFNATDVARTQNALSRAVDFEQRNKFQKLKKIFGR